MRAVRHVSKTMTPRTTSLISQYLIQLPLQALSQAGGEAQNGGDLQQRLEQLTTTAPVMLFIKVRLCK